MRGQLNTKVLSFIILIFFNGQFLVENEKLIFSTTDIEYCKINTNKALLKHSFKFVSSFKFLDLFLYYDHFLMSFVYYVSKTQNVQHI